MLDEMFAMMKTDMPHVTWECYELNEEKLRDKKFVFDFLNYFPGALGLAVIGEPVVHKFKMSDKKPGDGVTGIVILAESHLAVHTWPETRYAVIDLFSCKIFDIGKADRLLRQFFGPGRYKKDLVYRGEELIKSGTEIINSRMRQLQQSQPTGRPMALNSKA
jgi:S-adenosylmethionine decarboxylase